MPEDSRIQDSNSLKRLKRVLKPETAEQAEALAELYRSIVPPKDVCIAYCSGALMHAKFVESLLETVQGHPRIGYCSQVITGPAMALARRDQIQGFINDTPCNYVLMVDTDMHFTIDDVDRMLEAAETHKGVITGLYVDAANRPVVGMWDKGRERYHPLVTPPTSISKVSAAGAGFLLIPRWVFDHINPEWAFNEIATEEGRGVMGEDVSFCRRLADAKIDLWVHPLVQLGHCKEFILYPDGEKIPV